MLQQMPSPSCALAGEVETYNTYDYEFNTTYEETLPESKSRRNYYCTKCTFHSTKSRDFLLHLREAHFVKLKIYGCSNCDYASKHMQKLMRHMKVHQAMDYSQQNMEDYLEEVEECDDDEMDIEECSEDFERTFDSDNESNKMNSNEPTTSNSLKNKENYFSCDKCNYVTHIKSRFTKHVKYHSMPMIKCSICEFRTPYKWNLDRHNKNHGGTGSFHCCMCNFTADIKQSLTVHEMNHHSPAAGQMGMIRRRNRVGASDVGADSPAAGTGGRDEDGSDSRSTHSAEMGLQCTDRDVVNCNSDSNDATTSEPSAKRDDSHLAHDTSHRHSPTDEGKMLKQNRKTPRPLPPLIPLTPNQAKSCGEPPQKKLKESDLSTDTNNGIQFDNLPADISLIPVNNAFNAKEPIARKKNNSFFDKLKERLLTETGEEGSLKCKNCGFESKCLSEHSVHEKNCTPLNRSAAGNASVSAMGSTRCQNCRHRCKSSADLYIHLQTCGKNDNTDGLPDTQVKNKIDLQKIEKDVEPHPMENVVFVWNNTYTNQDSNKFEMPLDISIHDDSTMPDLNRSFDIDVTEDNDTMNLSPSQAAGKKVFKCPHCPFWASTASRFHVHIVGHLNKKPFECSLCKYKSNWRWDITKHIKLKSARDPEHNDAKVLMTDETGRRNYSKYNKFLAMLIMNENGENEFHYIDANTTIDSAMEIDESINDCNDITNGAMEMQPLNLQTQHDRIFDDSRTDDSKKVKKTLWKCKKCNYKDPSKEALLEHVREHSNDSNVNDSLKKTENVPDPADLAYRCGHCNQLSNWKHVIQRHCRLKHDGIIKVITTVKPKPDEILMNELMRTTGDACTKCPFRSSDKIALVAHMRQHEPSSQSIFKCYFCPYYVKDESELIQHLLLHGVTDPEEYIAKAMDGKSPTPDQGSGSKRHRCNECPYETNSKSQYMYHEQFHKIRADTPYKCPECNYSVSKRHLLHQHLRVHGIISKKSELDTDLDGSIPSKMDYEGPGVPDEIPYVWVSAKNEFHKMYKCRYCSYVNSHKSNIPNHEKIHCIVYEKSDLVVYKCLECKLTCDNAARLMEHSKTHSEIYGRIYCPVDEDIPDEEQIAKLRKVIEKERLNIADDSPKDLPPEREIKILYFCQKCPARFFSEYDLKNHDKLHNLTFLNKCESCEYSTPIEHDLPSHIFEHSDEYNTKTKMLKFMHGSHPLHKEPRLQLVHCPNTLEITWIVSNPRKNFEKPSELKNASKQYNCPECPAKFFKSSALSQHMVLHGGDGDHKCTKCSYAVRNVGNLAKHIQLHENINKNCDYDSGDDMDYKNIPLSGTDLFQRKTEAQKRVYIDKDKLVKPNDHFPPVLQADPQFGYLMHGNPEFIYPTYLKNGRQKEKRYKCHKCPSAFEKREQYKIHLSLHGSKQRYKCDFCDYSVKYYANYVQHMRKHQMNDEAQAERKKDSSEYADTGDQGEKHEEKPVNVKLAIKTMPRSAVKSDFQQFSISDQQTLKLLQRSRTINSENDLNTTETSPVKDRKLHMCLLCPYTNQRLDALNNHYRRHDSDDIHNTGNHKCHYCNLVVVQSHFLKEHLKTHFSYQKHISPDCYIANEGVTLSVTKLDDEQVSTDLKLGTKNINYSCSEKKLFVNLKTGELLVE